MTALRLGRRWLSMLVLSLALVLSCSWLQSVPASAEPASQRVEKPRTVKVTFKRVSLKDCAAPCFRVGFKAKRFKRGSYSVAISSKSPDMACHSGRNRPWFTTDVTMGRSGKVQRTTSAFISGTCQKTTVFVKIGGVVGEKRVP